MVAEIVERPDRPPDEIVDEGGGWVRLTWFNVGDPRWAFVLREQVKESVDELEHRHREG